MLEEFLWQSRARFQAFNAICWMCENLQLGWQIDRAELHATAFVKGRTELIRRWEMEATDKKGLKGDTITVERSSRHPANSKADSVSIARTRTLEKLVDAPSLRQPGKMYPPRFTEPLARLMMDCRVGHRACTEIPSATDDEILDSLRRMATHVVEVADIPTLQRAITAANELRKYLKSRTMHIEINKLEPVVLEEFLCQMERSTSWKQSRARFQAICWMCKNLQLGWPIDSVEPRDSVDMYPFHTFSAST